jgi:type IV secretion system protein VirB9
MKKTILSLTLLGTLGAAPIVHAADYLSADTAPLSAKEKKAIAMATEWSKGGTQPFMSGGKLTYVHGGGGVATVIAEPFQVCDVELEPGEQVNEIVVGDSARWLVEAGAAGKSVHLFIKPLDSGLESSAVITTDRRVYHLRLVSRRGGYTPYIGFVYAGDLRKQALARSAQTERAKEWSSTEDNEGKALDLSALNFGYEVDGKASWKPERVYDDGQKTYIQLPASVRTGEMPVLLVKKGDRDVLVNYRVKGQTMQVDGLFQTIALVVGVGGDQETVEISRRNG